MRSFLTCCLPLVLCLQLRADQAEVMVPMRDGVELATSVLLPDGDGPWPCVLSRTPYNKVGLRIPGAAFVSAGYAFVAQDCRGKFKSKGKYDPFKTDHHDGYDTVEWCAAQEWCNGKVGMVGASALGMTANLAATQTPPHLVCAYVIVAPASARRNTVYMGGVYRKELNDGWLMMQKAKFAIDETVRHPAADPYWDWREITAAHHRINIPIYNVGGWFDIFSEGTVQNFVGLQSRGAGRAAGNQRLVIGPFAHGFLGGRLKFPDANPGKWLGPKEQIRWFDRWLRGKKNGIDREPPVLYYVLGDPEDPKAPGNEWRKAVSWPPPSRPTSFFLHPKRTLRRMEPVGNNSVTYVYDPDDPVATHGGSNLILGGKGPMDQRKVGERPDYLRFHSEPLAAPLEIAGKVSVDLYIDSDAPDTDFTAKLVDVYPDGYEALLLDSIIRARYRHGLDREVPLKKGDVDRVRIDLWSTAIVFNKGHRIGLHISSSNDPRFDPNPNTGKPLRDGGEKRKAKNTVHFSPSHPSRLLLPLVKEYAAGG